MAAYGMTPAQHRRAALKSLDVALLHIVAAIERWKTHKPTTDELRKAVRVLARHLYLTELLGESKKRRR